MAVRSTTVDGSTPTTGAGRVRADLEAGLEAHRRELTAHCYRMLGSGFEAEDAVQETMVRAWRSLDDFEGRSALRSWLYRIATNVCLDMLRGPQRRARPMDLGPSSTADTMVGTGLPEATWLQPVHDGAVVPDGGDPAEVAAARDSVRLAFVAALQHLPARQRAVLLLREVLKWRAAEVAELLDTSVASVNSALQRARATLAAMPATDVRPDVDERHEELLEQYVAAFEAYDIAALVRLLRHDVAFEMPPYTLWLRGADQVGAWMVGQGAGCRGSRTLRTRANGVPAFASYRAAGPGTWAPWSIVVLDVSAGTITGIHNFLGGADLFAAFDLPARLEA